MRVFECYLNDDHLNCTFNQQALSSNFINKAICNQSGKYIDPAGDRRGEQRGIAAESHSLEQHRSIEHDHIDSGELLEHMNNGSTSKLRNAPLPHQVPVRMFLLSRELCRTAELVEFSAHVDLFAANFLQTLQCLFLLPALKKTDRSFDDEQRTEEKKQGWHRRPAEREPPADFA